MMRIKKLPIVLTLIFFIFAWYSQNKAYLASYGVEEFVTLQKFKELLYYMNNSASGYSSIQNYSLVYLIPFILVLQHLFNNEKVIEVMRFKQREKVFLLKLKDICVAASIIAGIHSVVNIIFSLLFFDAEMVIKSNLIEYSFYNGVCLCFFYIAVGLLYNLQKDWLRSVGLAMIGTLLMVGGTFFLSKIVLTNYWTPIMDLVILSGFFEETLSLEGTLWIYGKQSMAIIILYLLCSVAAARKDYID